MIHIILGTKAQLIKMAPVMLELTNKGISYRLISTGQHRETMDEILCNFGLKPPDYFLYKGVDITSIPKMVVWFVYVLWRSYWNRDVVFDNDKRGIILVHGDTFSTLLGALIGKFAGLTVGHVESGLRSYNLFNPFPEEITRLITFRLSDYLFCPGSWAVGNVQKYKGIKIDTGGNTLGEALALALENEEVPDVDIPSQPFAVVTIHRFENIYSSSTLGRVMNVVKYIARKKHLLFILHKPTENKLREFGLFDQLVAMDRVEIRSRYDYFSFIKLLSKADFVVSDGGGNQEECYYLGKPLLLLRKVTERQEGLGENCVLSHYDLKTVENFINNWQCYCFSTTLLSCTPSRVIAESVADYK